MRISLTIAAKLAVAYVMFLAPIAYLGYQMVSDKETNIEFALKEITGIRYIAVIRSVQDAVVRGADMADMVERTRDNEKALGAYLKTAAHTEILASALAGPDRGVAVQAAADLIGKAADGSNLTLDPDLDSFYTQDALTVKVPAAVANAASLARAVASTTGHTLSVAEQVSVGVQVGGLQPALDGLASDIDNAVKGNPDETVDSALTPLVIQVANAAKTVLAALANHAEAADAYKITRPLLDVLTAAGTADADELEHLLNARIAGFRVAEMTSSGVAIALFLTAVVYVLVVVQRGAIKPLRALTTTMSKLAARNLAVEIDGMARRDEVGGMARAVQVFKDNMIRADALAAREASSIRASERRFRSLVQNTSDMILICAAPGTITYQSPAAGSTWGYPADELLDVSLIALIHPDDQPAAQEVWEQLRQSPPDGDEGATRSTGLRLRDHGGIWRQAELVVTNLLHDPAMDGLVVTIRDVTERKTFEQQLVRQAFYDGLTGLPNRVLFRDRFEQALVRAAQQGSLVGLLFLDLDNFKLVNDGLGHQTGDYLLTEAAARLRSCIRAQDTVARLGGDEFVIVLELLTGEEDALPVAKAITHQFSRPFTLDGRDVVVTASIGVAISGPGREDADNLLRDADVAMYRAKSDGRAHHVVFRPSMHADSLARLELENDLRGALVRGELRVYYQPIVMMESGAFNEVEALVRWQHPTRGLIAPGEFIPIAEETGLIVPLGLWVLEEACRQVAAWHLQRPDKPALTLSVNLSPRQFQQHSLVADVACALRNAGLPARCLKLEITEGVIVRNVEATIRTLWELKSLGLKLAIDDFGTGYSSLSYLKRLPIDVLKIDRSFVSGIGQDQADAAIIHAIMALAKSLNLKVTGEGIETAEQAALLGEWGCNQGQGYFYSKPLDSHQAAVLLGTAETQVSTQHFNRVILPVT